MLSRQRRGPSKAAPPLQAPPSFMYGRCRAPGEVPHQGRDLRAGTTRSAASRTGPAASATATPSPAHSSMSTSFMPSPSVATRSARPRADRRARPALRSDDGGVDELDVLGLRADDVQPPAPAVLQVGEDVVHVGGRRDQHQLGRRPSHHLGRQVRHGVDGDLHVLRVASRPRGDLLHVEAVVDVGVQLTSHLRDVTHDLAAAPPSMGMWRSHSPLPRSATSAPWYAHHRAAGHPEPRRDAPRTLQHAARADDGPAPAAASPRETPAAPPPRRGRGR